ncbi:hypothetical protein SISNIDRAFT_403190 [Sistotremastrum niveocremeum HHB9708]|uniref:M-phase inducer phosphatase n=1 Tax=Sistotremastrum niveocremeum HHB9708 TaxID=1314777 RepID=A0A165AFN9_9AGAM|nr:hypothetical protein SISNIDRAFT_403190 [Sistotremastrum niveocremeum HHB9708]
MSLFVPPNAPKRITRPRDELDDFLTSDLEVSFASSISLNSPPRSTRNVLASFSPMDMDMDVSPAPKPVKTRPRARTFGRDILNAPSEASPIASLSDKRSVGSRKGLQRAALPTFWLQSQSPIPATPPEEVSLDDAMEVDSPGSQPFASAIPAVSLEAHFLDSHSPAPVSRKRRSASPEHTLSSSPPSSPSQRKFERFASGTVFPPRKPRRPTISALIPPQKIQAESSQGACSAYPILSPAETTREHPSGLPPTRRAFSAMIAPGPSFMDESLSSDDSFIGSSPAGAYAKRHEAKVIRRCDGTDDFRRADGVTALRVREQQSSPKVGLPPFGSEAQGKILPCFAVKDDGLMRITGETLNDLIDGRFNSQIADYKVIDCRFDYEYAGGHIPGAINVSSTAAIDELLLSRNLPEPSSSGDGKPGKTVLVFHCEFSVMRAPTIAKHLRSSDRNLNNHIYPRVHYPEVYILAGGYSQYFQEQGHRCEPRSYVCMDDPSHSRVRDSDLDTFRKAKWGRTRSYTYGEAGSRTSSSFSSNQRNTAPTGGGVGPLFAAANAARSRRGGVTGPPPALGLTTLSENCDPDARSSDDHLGGSPCPPPSKVGGMKTISSFRPLDRTTSYGARMR